MICSQEKYILIKFEIARYMVLVMRHCGSLSLSAVCERLAVSVCQAALACVALLTLVHAGLKTTLLLQRDRS